MNSNAVILPRNARDAAAASASRGVLDPSALGVLPWVPLIPEVQRRQHHVFIAADHRFKAAARFLQALWREDRDLAIGIHKDLRGKRRRLGSRISTIAGGDGANFLHPRIIPIVAHALHYREPGAVYDVDRLKTNLLSSQPLTFNLFGLLVRDLDLAARFVTDLLPGAMAKVTDINFEHSPGRGDPRFTADGTAFDLAIHGRSATGERVFIGIEVKYSESGYEPAPRLNKRYATLAPTTGLFIDAADPNLAINPCQQLFRQHCLAASILDQGLADQAIVAFIAPSHNRLAHTAATTYARHLHSASTGRIPFIALTLERVITALATAGLHDHARALHRRYTDWWLVDGELDIAAVAPAPSASGDTSQAEATTFHPHRASSSHCRKTA